MRATTFVFGPYRADWKTGKLEFDYTIQFSDSDDLHFTETVEVPAGVLLSPAQEEVLQAILPNLSLMLGISYYKLYVPPEIELTHPISETQAEFWNTVYRKGLGEFWYRNNVDPAMFPGFPNRVLSAASPPQPLPDGIGERVLLGIGGGKDSIVAAELLKKEGVELAGFRVSVVTDRTASETPASQYPDLIKAVATQAGLPLRRIRRTLDEKLMALPPEAYSGHIPISAIFAWLGVLLAVLEKYSWVAVGNEQSSNFGNITWKGLEINHQWSKSQEFEGLFQTYLRECITEDVRYFSALRPFSELRITNLFTRYPQYFGLFSSCNRISSSHYQGTATHWCGECPKCAFAFAMLAAFMPKPELVGIFGKNLLDDKKLLPTYEDLVGLGTMKPFDCVGTFEETQAALRLAGRKSGGFGEDVVMQSLLPRLTVTEEQTREIFRAQPAPTVPPRFQFVGITNVLILGYGREGKVTEQFLKRFYPQLEIGIADANNGPNYLEKQQHYDLVIKTPGIPRRTVAGHFTTATNIFFSRVTNTVIGVTGSKGKSTTASLIFHILKAAGKDVQLLGNIGVPMLSALLAEIPPERVFVLELSSQQLEDISASPQVAVVTSLFPEHMDYHGSVKAYYEAKKHITAYQKRGDFFVYDPAHVEVSAWAGETRAASVPFAEKLPLPADEIPLLGEHNVKNVAAAVAVSRLLNIPDTAAAEAIRGFHGLPHRLELIAEVSGVRFYDDAISTAPESTIEALRAVPKVGTLFLGGTDRGYDFGVLADEVKKAGVHSVVLFPESGANIKPLLPPTVRLLETDSMDKGVAFAFEHTRPGEAVLLSTASPSYSLWTNFEEQGNEFQKWVKARS